MDFIFMTVAVVIAIWLWIFVPAQMAKRRHREVGIWVLISLAGSPLLAILLLIALGDADG